jgi:hypothetical protein
MRSSPGMRAATRLGWLNVAPRSVEWVAVMPGASVRLVRARLGTLPSVGKLMEISTSPPPSAIPMRSHPKAKIPQSSGRPRYVK